MKWEKRDFLITDNREDLDPQLIHQFLHDSYWAKEIPKKIVTKSIENSLCFGLFHNDKQIGFGRAITDRATFAYLADVFVIEQYRGCGLGKWLITCIKAHPDLKNLRRWMLVTTDAQGLYERYGFSPLPNPKNYMEISTPEIYQSSDFDSSKPVE